MDATNKIYSLDVLDKKTFLSILIMSILISLLSLIVPVAAQMLVNIVAFARIMQPILVISLVVLAILIGSSILIIWQHVIVEIIQQKLFVNVVIDSAKKLPFLNRQALPKQKGPELVNQFFDVITVQKTLADLLIYGTNIIISSLFGMILLALYHPYFLIFDLLLIVAMALALWLPYRTALQMAHEECSQKHRIASWLEELVQHRDLFRFNRNQEFALKEADHRLVDYLKARNRHFSMIIRHLGAIHGISAVAMCLLLGVGGYLVIINQLSLGQLVAAEIVLSGIVSSFKHLSVLLKDYYDMVASNKKVDHLLNLPAEQQRKELSSADVLELAEFQLEIKDFLASDEDAEPLNALIHPGKLLMLSEQVQERNIHKLMAFLTGHVVSFHGEVLLNGRKTNHYLWYELRESVVLLRDLEVFSGTLKENLLLGRSVSDKKLFDVLESLGFAEKLIELEQGLDTSIAANEQVFSYAELRLMMLARAVLAEPRLMIIDEFLDGLSDSQCRLARDFLSKQEAIAYLIYTRQSTIAKAFETDLQGGE